jgi:aconitate hydratase
MAVANLAAETGATGAVFPADERTRVFLRAQGRDADWKALGPDPDAVYAETLEVALDALEPLVACPPRPDQVRPLRELEGMAVRQVCIGSCTNGWAEDLLRAAALLAGRRVHPAVDLVVTPGTRQVLAALEAAGAAQALRRAGARLLESACGPCIGAGDAPAAGSASLRSFSRNLPGRAGERGARVFLAGPEACAAAAVRGCLTDPRALAGTTAPPEEIEGPRAEDSWLARPGAGPAGAAAPPAAAALPERMRGAVLLRLGDGVTTDCILAGGTAWVSAGEDGAALARRAFLTMDPAFGERALAHGGGFVVAGRGYGMGNGRADGALALAALGVRVVAARSFARAHRDALVRHGVLPLLLATEQDYEGIREGDELEVPGLPEALESGRPLVVRNLTRGLQLAMSHDLEAREIEWVKAGGVLARDAAALA